MQITSPSQILAGRLRDIEERFSPKFIWVMLRWRDARRVLEACEDERIKAQRHVI